MAAPRKARVGAILRTQSVCLVTLLIATAAAAPARAEGDDDQKDEKPTHFELSVSSDASTVGDRSASASLTVSPFGDLDESGWRLRVEGDASHYVYPNPLATGSIAGDEIDEDAMIGYSLQNEKWSVSLFFGADRQNASTSVADPTNPTIGIKTGPKMELETSYDPTETLSFESSFEWAVPNETMQIDLRVPYTIQGDLRLGPQVVYQSDVFYREWRIGPSLSGLKLGPVKLTLGIGYINDALQGSGAYATLDSELRF